MVIPNKFPTQQLFFCWVFLIVLFFHNTIIAQKSKSFYLQAHAGIFQSMPNYIGINPKNYLNTPNYDHAGFLSGTGGALGYQINSIFGIEIAYQHHQFQAANGFVWYSGGSYIQDQGTSWGIRSTVQKYINLKKIGWGTWYLQGFFGLLNFNNMVTPISASGSIQDKLLYNNDTLQMDIKTNKLKQNFLNLEAGLRIEKLLSKNIGVFLAFSHSFGLGTVYHEDISFTYGGVPQGSIERTYSGAGIYTNIGLRYHFDLPFLKKKTNKSDMENIKVIEPPKFKRKSQFIFRIF